MKAVAAGDEIGLDPLFDAVDAEGHRRPVVGEIMQRDIRSTIDDLDPAGRRRIHQVARHLGLAVDGDALAGQRGDVDADQMFAIGEVEAIFDHPLGGQSRAEPELVEQIGRAAFEHPGADPPEDVIGRLALDHDHVDPLGAQQMREQQPGGSRADHRDLRAARAHDAS